LYSDSALAQIFNTDIANAGISVADMTSSGTGIYNSIRGFFLGGSTGQNVPS